MSYKKPKCLRKDIKNSKRILKLMYRSGLLDNWIHLDIHWDAYKPYNKKLRFKNLCYIEPHYWIVDYYGEGDQRELISDVLDNHIVDSVLKHKDIECEEVSRKVYEWYKNHNSTRKLIIYLKSLPVKRSDSKINKILIINMSDL